MTPIEFPEHNLVIGKNQEKYLPLPAYKPNDSGDPNYPYGQVTTCWKFTWRERFRILFGKKLWMQQWTFHTKLQPVKMSTDKTDFFITEKPE